MPKHVLKHDRLGQEGAKTMAKFFEGESLPLSFRDLWPWLFIS